MENEQIKKVYKEFLETQEKVENIKNDIENTNENYLEKSFESSDNSNHSENDTEVNNQSENLLENKAARDLKNNKTENSIDNTLENNSAMDNSLKDIDFSKTNQNENLNRKEEGKHNVSNVSNKEEEKKAENKSLTFNPDEYVIMMTIGRGNFSEVFLVENINTKILYAMKQFLKQRIDQLKKQEEVLMEKHVMNKITPHEYIIGNCGSYRDSVIIFY